MGRVLTLPAKGASALLHSFTIAIEEFVVTKLEQLESELKQKINELNDSLNIQYFLREQLTTTTTTLKEIESQLHGIEVFLRYSNECVYELKRENEKLKLTNDEWMKRAINLEFKVLSARGAAKE